MRNTDKGPNPTDTLTCLDCKDELAESAIDGRCRECYWELWLPVPTCPDCGDEFTGAVFNGRCLDCHETRVLPIPRGGVPETGELWSDIYLGHDD